MIVLAVESFLYVIDLYPNCNFMQIHFRVISGDPSFLPRDTQWMNLIVFPLPKLHYYYSKYATGYKVQGSHGSPAMKLPDFFLTKCQFLLHNISPNIESVGSVIYLYICFNLCPRAVTEIMVRMATEKTTWHNARSITWERKTRLMQFRCLENFISVTMQRT